MLESKESRNRSCSVPPDMSFGRGGGGQPLPLQVAAHSPYPSRPSVELMREWGQLLQTPQAGPAGIPRRFQAGPIRDFARHNQGVARGRHGHEHVLQSRCAWPKLTQCDVLWQGQQCLLIFLTHRARVPGIGVQKVVGTACCNGSGPLILKEACHLPPPRVLCVHVPALYVDSHDASAVYQLPWILLDLYFRHVSLCLKRCPCRCRFA